HGAALASAPRSLRRLWGLASALAVAAVPVASGLAPARAATVTALSGPTSIFFTDCSNAGIVLRFFADPAPLTLRTGDIALAKPAEGAPRAPIAWTVTWEAPTASDPSIHEYQSVGSLKNGCPLPGRYKLPVTVFQKQENGDITKTPLAIEVVRTVDPTLDAASPVSLVLETWPFDGAVR